MKASPEDQLRLLDLQALDSTIDRLALRRRTLPEHAQIAEVEAELGGYDDRLVLARTDDSDLAQQQAKLETDIDVVRGRMSRDQQRLDTGQVSSPRELENLQSEIASLRRRQTELEDSDLELMEQRAEIEQAITALTDQKAAAETRLAQLVEQRDATLAAIDEESTAAGGAREPLAGQLPGDLLALYEKIRASADGVGVAALRRGRCEGCHLTLNTTDLNALRDAPPDEVLRCEECRRILVRTAESGL